MCACVYACIGVRVMVSTIHMTHVEHWLISQLSSLKATGRGLLKVHAIALAMSKNTSLLDMPDHRRCRLVVS